MQNFYFIVLYVLKTGVPTIILIPNILGKNVYFLSYINLKFQKGSPMYIFCTQDSLKWAGDSPAPEPSILKLNARNFVVHSGAQPRCIPQNFKHLFSILPVLESGIPLKFQGITISKTISRAPFSKFQNNVAQKVDIFSRSVWYQNC